MEFESKIHMVNIVLNTFKTNDTKSRTRRIGKVYKNIDGNETGSFLNDELFKHIANLLVVTISGRGLRRASVDFGGQGKDIKRRFMITIK
jgi:hypothetical protein